MTSISFRVPGEPVPQGGMRAFNVGGKARVTHSNPKGLGDYRARVALAAQAAGAKPLEGALDLDVLFVLPRPKSHYGTGKNADVLKPSAPRLHSGARPDIDKILRALLDALTGTCCKDDGQIAAVTMAKQYTDELHPSPCTSVFLEEIPG